MALNPLSTILTQNKLDGDNYVDQKCNLDIVLMPDKHKWVLTTPCPDEPTAKSINDQIAEYNRWKASDEMAKCYMLGSMNNILQQQHRSMETTVNIMFSINEIFTYLRRHAKQEAITSFMNLLQSKGTPIREHMMKVIAYLNEVEMLSAKIDVDTQISMVMSTLFDSFNQFSVDYELHL